MNNLILVTGATGYIASRLIPRMLDSGYRVRALAREPHRLKGRSWSRHVELVQGDVMTPSTLAPVLAGVHTAYYLIHNMTSGRGYTERELQGAHNFASAAAEAGVEHIIYLGGLADPEQHIAPHMRSRIETGVVLRQGSVPVTEFRAGVIAGSGSISFEMIRFMTELFPIVPGPTWLNNRTQPIAIQNIIDYLFAALTNPNGRGQVFEIGGPEIVLYKDLMLRYARIRGLKRKMLLLPYIPLWFMAFGVGLMTPVPRRIAYALIGGLSADSIVKHDEALRVFPEVKLIGFDEATQHTLDQLSPAHIERVWDDNRHYGKLIKHEGCFIDHREVRVNVLPEKVFQAITHLIRPNWRTVTNESNQQIVVCVEDQIVGEKWIEWRVNHVESVTHITQTILFAPRGLAGFLYWYLLCPIHVLSFRGFIRAITRVALSSRKTSSSQNDS
jgi:uncharacterized protein YbjT (DUF2867 family)